MASTPLSGAGAIPGTWENVFDDGDLLALDKPTNTTNEPVSRAARPD